MKVQVQVHFNFKIPAYSRLYKYIININIEREREDLKDTKYMITLEKICMQEFLKGGALSIDGLIEERAPLY